MYKTKIPSSDVPRWPRVSAACPPGTVPSPSFLCSWAFRFRTSSSKQSDVFKRSVPVAEKCVWGEPRANVCDNFSVLLVVYTLKCLCWCIFYITFLENQRCLENFSKHYYKWLSHHMDVVLLTCLLHILGLGLFLVFPILQNRLREAFLFIVFFPFRYPLSVSLNEPKSIFIFRRNLNLKYSWPFNNTGVMGTDPALPAQLKSCI